MGQNTEMNSSRARVRAITVNNKVYKSLELTKEEKEAGNVIKLNVKEYTGQLGKSTLTVDDNPESVFGTIIDVLEKEETKFQMSETHWKLAYTQSKLYALYDEESKIEEEEKIREQAIIQI